MIAETRDTVGWAAVLVALIGICGTWVAGKWQNRNIKDAPVDMAEAWSKLIKELQAELARRDRVASDREAAMTVRIGQLANELDSCNARHVNSDARIAELERDLADLHAQIARPPDLRTRSTD